MLRSSLVLAVLACAACAPHALNSLPAHDDIVHGHSVPANDDMGHSVVALVEETNDGEQALCSGSIVDDHTVLTAAHCVRDAAKIVVAFGRSLKDKGGVETRPAQDAKVHPSADLALLRFNGGLPDGYTPITIAKADPQVGEAVLLIGYGVSNGLENKGAGTMRETRTTIEEIDGDAIVSDGEKHSACFGDSGGPEFIQVEGEWQQVGVAHAVLDQGCDEASVHTALAPYLDWIHSSR